MNLYDFFKTIHILAAIAWVGGAMMGQVQGMRLGGSRDPQRLLAYAEEQSWLGKYFYGPAAGVVLLAGIAMVFTSGWEFTDAWIIVGLVGFAASAVLTMGFLSPRGEKLVADLRDGGLESPGMAKQIQEITRLSQIDTAILILVVMNMVIKPGT